MQDKEEEKQEKARLLKISGLADSKKYLITNKSLKAVLLRLSPFHYFSYENGKNLFFAIYYFF